MGRGRHGAWPAGGGRTSARHCGARGRQSIRRPIWCARPGQHSAFGRGALSVRARQHREVVTGVRPRAWSRGARFARRRIWAVCCLDIPFRKSGRTGRRSGQGVLCQVLRLALALKRPAHHRTNGRFLGGTTSAAGLLTTRLLERSDDTESRNGVVMSCSVWPARMPCLQRCRPWCGQGV